MSHNPKMSGGVGYIGSKISLISRSDIRYVGILHSINSADSTVALEQVRSYGTEGRKGNPSEEIPQSDNVFEYIVFRGSDVKDLHVCEAPAQQATMPPQVPNDPAILGTTAPVRPQYQPFAPPPLGVQPPPNFPAAPINPFYLQQAAAAAFQQQQHQQPQAYWPPHPQPPQINLPDNVSKEAEQPKVQQQKEHAGPDKPEDHKLDGTALSSKNLKTGPNIRQNIGHPVSIRNEVIKDVASSVAVEKLAKKVSELSVQTRDVNGDLQPSNHYERPSQNNNNHTTSRSNNDNRSSSNNRLPGMGGHLVQVNRRRGGRRSYSQNYDRNRIPVPASDFDFESSNAKFNKDELVKEVVKKIHPNHDSKEEEAIEAHGTEDDEEEEDPNESFYDRSKSFFDNISCETKERLEQQGPDGRRGLSVAERRQKQSEERRLNLETFGQVSIDGGRYRGRGYRGYRGNRGGGYRGGYSNNYRGGSGYRGGRGGSSVGGNYRSNQTS